MAAISPFHTFRLVQIPYKQYDLGQWPKANSSSTYDSAKQAKSLSFVDYTTISDEEVTRNKHLVRSHISKRNRKATRVESSSAERDKQPHSVKRQHDSATNSSDKGAASQEVSAQGCVELLQRCTPLSVPKAPPYLGLVTPKLHIDVKPEAVAATAQYVQHAVLGRILYDDSLAQKAADEWIRAFYQYPVILHSFFHLAATHHDLCNNQISQTGTRQALEHKVNAITALNHHLSEPLNQERADVALCAMLCLGKNNMDRSTLANMFSTDSLLFDPPLQTSIYGRLNMVDEHFQATGKLIQLLGGLQNVKLPGLALLISFAELTECSKRAIAPRVASLWAVDLALLHRQHNIERANHKSGRGFFVKVSSDTLPGPFVRLLIHLALLSQVLSAHKVDAANETQTFAIFDTRMALQHQLLSSPAWEQLDDATQKSSECGIYSCCWLAALIYSNAVLYAIPPHSGWHSKLAGKLRSRLVAYSYDSWPSTSDDLVLWILFVGAIASLKTLHRTFFLDALRSILKKRNNPHWSTVHDVLTEFLWSDRACIRGAYVVWVSLSESP